MEKHGVSVVQDRFWDCVAQDELRCRKGNRGEEWRVNAAQKNGKGWVTVREYYATIEVDDAGDPVLAPGKKGLSLPTHEARNVIGAMLSQYITAGVMEGVRREEIQEELRDSFAGLLGIE